MDDDLDEARDLLPGCDLEPVDALGGSDRSRVRRARLTRPGEDPVTVIVKTFTGPGHGWEREAAALAALGGRASAPGLVAAGAAHRVVVMTDLGSGTSVADALLGDDPDAASAAVYAWADAIASIHRASADARDPFRRALDGYGGSGRVPLDGMDLARTIGDLRSTCAPLGVDVPPGLVDAFLAEAARLTDDAASALSPTDACPDNNLLTADGLALIDFEGAAWRHIAWDVAYLRVPWPSCWCSWRLPDDLADAAVDRYRAAMAPHRPYVSTPDFTRDGLAASTLWSVVYSSWFLPRALASDALPYDLVAPTRRALLLHRLARAAEESPVPAIAGFAARLRATLVDRWGEVPLDLAPAFR